MPPCGRGSPLHYSQAPKRLKKRFLPAGLLDAGDLALIGQLSEADTADAEISQIGVGPAAYLAAVVIPGGKLAALLLL